MAESDNEDASSKTQDPTQKRLDQAAEEGRIAFSKELMHWTVMASSGALLLWVLPFYIASMMRLFRKVFESCGVENISEPRSPIYARLFILFGENILYLFIIVGAVLAAGFAQTKFNITLKSIAIKGERISPHKGFARLFSKNNLVEFSKNIAKVTFVGCVMFAALSPIKENVALMPVISPLQGVYMMQDLATQIFISALCAIGVIAGVDFAYQKFTHFQQLKMSHKEIKDEHKEQEGSPEIKGRMRQLRMQMMQRKLTDTVKTATVVVTNPTHYAVAIAWNEARMDTPIVVAKGTDYLAERIRKIAKDFDVPIVENAPLARSLYAKVELDHAIESEHYRTVAEVIRYVETLKTKRF